MVQLTCQLSQGPETERVPHVIGTIWLCLWQVKLFDEPDVAFQTNLGVLDVFLPATSVNYLLFLQKIMQFSL